MPALFELLAESSRSSGSPSLADTLQLEAHQPTNEQQRRHQRQSAPQASNASGGRSVLTRPAAAASRHRRRDKLGFCPPDGAGVARRPLRVKRRRATRLRRTTLNRCWLLLLVTGTCMSMLLSLVSLPTMLVARAGTRNCLFFLVAHVFVAAECRGGRRKSTEVDGRSTEKGRGGRRKSTEVD